MWRPPPSLLSAAPFRRATASSAYHSRASACRCVLRARRHPACTSARVCLGCSCVCTSKAPITASVPQGVARSPSALSPASSSGGGGKDVELALGRLAHVVGGSSDVRMSADAAASPKQQQAGAAASTMPPAADGIDLDEDAQDVGLLSWRAIFKLNWKLCVAVFMVYAVTLSIFPGFLAGKWMMRRAGLCMCGDELQRRPAAQAVCACARSRA